MYTLIVASLFAVPLFILHLIGYKTKGRWSRKIWKSGDYIWLSMAIFALIGGSYEARKAISEDIIDASNKAIVSNLEKRANNVSLATEELLTIVKHDDLSKVDDTRLGELADQASQLDKASIEASTRESEAKQNLDKNWLESHTVYFYPFVLALALALRITLASADIFDWYAKPAATKQASESQVESKNTDDIASESVDIESHNSNSKLETQS